MRKRKRDINIDRRTCNEKENKSRESGGKEEVKEGQRKRKRETKIEIEKQRKRERDKDRNREKEKEIDSTMSFRDLDHRQRDDYFWVDFDHF